MRTIVCLITAFIFLVLPAHVRADTVSGTVVMTVDLSAHDHGQDTQLWIPYPITDTDQTITNIQVDGDYSASGVYTDATFQTPMLYARWRSGAKKRTVTLSFDVTRQEVVRRAFPAREGEWDPRDFELYLAPTRLGPIDGEVKQLADSITAGQTTVLGKARALYDWTCDNTFRNPDTRGCGVGDVYQLLKEPGGKCTDISSVFVALARAAGVPAREVFGLRQGKQPAQEITRWQHCWAEFYLPGYGWVPVDPADVRKMMYQQGLELADSKTAEYRDYFWGGVDPYRIKLGEGRDLVLNPRHAGPPVNYLMYPFAQVGGRTLDWLDPETFAYKITYRKKS